MSLTAETAEEMSYTEEQWILFDGLTASCSGEHTGGRFLLVLSVGLKHEYNKTYVYEGNINCIMMEYNVNEVDRQLEMLFKSERDEVLNSLKSSMATGELSLELIITSIKHCKQQISNIDKIFQQKNNNSSVRNSLIVKRKAFEKNLMIWNLCGHVQLTSIQVKDVQKRLYAVDTNELQKRIAIGEASLLVYESSKAIIDCTGKDFMEFLNKGLTPKELSDFRLLRKELTTFREANSKYLKDIRVKSVAHRDMDILNQLDVIEELNWSDCIQLLLDYEKILNAFGAFLSSLIPLGNNVLAVAFK